MSRIGRLPVQLPKGVDVSIDGHTVKVKGPKGELTRTLHPLVEVTREDGSDDSKSPRALVKRMNDSQMARAIHGLSRTLVANMVTGVTQGYSKDLEISGTGYRAQLVGKKLQLALGYSHPIEIDPPAGIAFTTETPQRIKVAGIDKEVVGEIAAKIRALRIPDPYKAKGVKYAGEVIRRKAGKAGKVGAKGAGPA